MNLKEAIGYALNEVLKWFGIIINFLTDWGLAGPSEWVIIGTVFTLVTGLFIGRKLYRKR